MAFDTASLARESHRLVNSFSGARLCGVGNACAWLLEGCKIEAALTGVPLEVTSAPFSGGCCARGESAFTFRQNRRVTQDQLDWYAGCLAAHRASPRCVVEAYEKRGQRTVFLDRTVSGLSFASFLSVFFTIAKQQGLFTRARHASFIVPLLTERQRKLACAPTLALDKIARLPLQPFFLKEDGLWALEDSDQKKLRLVPSCGIDQWGYELSRPTISEKDVAHMRKKLTRVIKKNYVPAKGFRRFIPFL